MQEVDLFLRKSRNNDEFARCVRGRNRSSEETKYILVKWASCQHIFVKVREEDQIRAHHSSDCETTPVRYECVRCGLTNRLIDSEGVLDKYNQSLSDLFYKKQITDETVEWDRQKPKISDENLLSRESIQSFHPGVLFDIAVELCLAQNIKITKKNVFNVMRELSDMETLAEQLKISTIVHASALIERYKVKHGLYVDDD